MFEFPLNSSSYVLQHIIAKTECSEVYVARCVTNGKLVCVRIINLDQTKTDCYGIRKKVSFFSNTSHPNLTEYYGAFVTENNLWILTEFMDGGSILDILQFAYVNGIKDRNILASIIEQVLLFLVYWHKDKHIHRDIRPGTILLSTDGCVKVGSVGRTTALIKNGKKFDAKHALVGTFNYLAPEMVNGGDGYTEKADIWSLGITIIELVTGKNPFSCFDTAKATELISKGEVPEICKAEIVSKKLNNFLDKCLQCDPKKRASAEELLETSFIKLSRGSKYISTILMSNLPLLSQRYEMLHPNDDNTKVEEPKQVSNIVFDLPGTTLEQTVQEPQVAKEAEKATITTFGSFTITVKHNSPKSSSSSIPKISCPFKALRTKKKLISRTPDPSLMNITV